MKLFRYIKVIIPILVLIGLFIFRNYYANHLSDEITIKNHSGNNPKTYPQYDLTSDRTNYHGTLLEFGANNCSACRQMEVVLKEIRSEYSDRLIIRFINTTRKEGLIIGREFGIISIPMQVLINKQGEVVFKHTGYISTDDLKEHINNKLLIN